VVREGAPPLGARGGAAGPTRESSAHARDLEKERQRAALKRRQARQRIGALVLGSGFAIAAVTVIGLRAWEEPTVDAAPLASPHPTTTEIPREALVEPQPQAPAAPQGEGAPAAEAHAEAATEATTDAAAEAQADAPPVGEPRPLPQAQAQTARPAQRGSTPRVFGAPPLWLDKRGTGRSGTQR
jgi:hypothetical protein